MHDLASLMDELKRSDIARDAMAMLELELESEVEPQQTPGHTKMSQSKAVR